jgi:hypothetical protein
MLADASGRTQQAAPPNSPVKPVTAPTAANRVCVILTVHTTSGSLKNTLQLQCLLSTHSDLQRTSAFDPSRTFSKGLLSTHCGYPHSAGMQQIITAICSVRRPSPRSWAVSTECRNLLSFEFS